MIGEDNHRPRDHGAESTQTGARLESASRNIKIIGQTSLWAGVVSTIAAVSFTAIVLKAPRGPVVVAGRAIRAVYRSVEVMCGARARNR